MSKILSSKELVKNIYESITPEINSMEIKPTLAIILVGDRKDSLTYIKLKRKKCSEIGIDSVLHSFDRSISEQEIISLIVSLNNNNIIKGIILQLPLPDNFTKEEEYNILNTVSPLKDVDGFHYKNVGNLTLNKDGFIPCTAEGCFELLKYHNINIVGKHCVIVGSSKVVGVPLSLLLLHNGATTTLCNIHTENIKDITKQADILISCCGSPHLIDSSWIKENTIILDVGINHIDKKIVGDVDYENVLSKVKLITPVPGCIGPLTIAILMKHLLI